MTIADFLMNHKKGNPVSFHMPGHKGRTTIYKAYGYTDFVKGMFGNDITEIPGADALQQPQFAIREVMNNYARLYGALHTELLVGGSSVGLMAAILATVPRGGKIIIGRNSHKSVMSAIRLGGITPVYVEPELHESASLQGSISAKSIFRALRDNSDAAAVLVTSPNYYGVLSEVGNIAEAVHSFGKILIVDQAHGAHLKFFDEGSRVKWAAENLGADIVVDSTHKTLLTFTGSAILNVCSEKVDLMVLGDYLRMLQTTSPSYLMMGTLDINERILEEHGAELIGQWRENLRFFYGRLGSIPGVDVIRGRDIDPTKINISMARMGLTGDALEEELRRRDIWIELVHGDWVMLMTGIGNVREDYAALLAALENISMEYGVAGDKMPEGDDVSGFELEFAGIPERREEIPLFDAVGRVAYEGITPYPPGIPVVCPGEVISYEVVQYIEKLMSRGKMVVGVSDEGMVSVGVED